MTLYNSELSTCLPKPVEMSLLFALRPANLPAEGIFLGTLCTLISLHLNKYMYKIVAGQWWFNTKGFSILFFSKQVLNPLNRWGKNKLPDVLQS
jgi:hypothetical protein